MDDTKLTRLTVAGFAAFNLAYLAVKLATVSAAHYDYAKELYNAQHLRWVYEAGNPPLYTWLLSALTRITGPGVEAPLILTHLLLFAVMLAAFALGRRLLGSTGEGALAAWLFLTLHQVFRFQFARTHSLLMVLFVLLALLAFVGAMREGRWRDYGWLGLALGAGLLSKYAFAGFLGALVLGGLATREGRKALATPRITLTLAALLAVILPVALAGADQWAALAEIFKTKTTQAAASPGLPVRLAAVLALAGQVVVFAAVPVLAIGAAIAVGLAGRRDRSHEASAADQDAVRLLAAVMLAGLAILLVGVLAGAVERISGRFLLPFLLPLPFVVVALARRYAQASLRSCAIAVAAVLLAQAWVRVIDLTPYCSGKCTDLAPYDRLAERLRADGFPRGAVTTTDVSLAGNIVATLPGSAATVREVRQITRPRLPSRPHCLLIWRADAQASAKPPLTLVNASGLDPADAAAKARLLRVSWRWPSRDRFRPLAPGARRTSTWGVILLKRGEGSCR